MTIESNSLSDKGTRPVRDYPAARRLYYGAMGCALLPLVAGLVAAWGYYATYKDWLQTAGVLLVPLGAAVGIVGLMLLLLSHQMYRQCGADSGLPARRRPFGLVLMLFLANVPAAVLVVVGTERLARVAYIDIVNESGAMIESVSLRAGLGAARVVGPIAPNSVHHVRMAEGDLDQIEVTSEQDESQTHTTVYPGWTKLHVLPGNVLNTEEMH